MIASTSWGVLVALHQCHRLVKENLSARQIDHFVPMEKRCRIVRGKRQEYLYPLFGRYVLCAITSMWCDLRHMRGVAGMLVNESGYPAQVVQGEVERIKEFCQGDVFRLPETTNVVGFSYGQRVTPKAGPLVYHVGRFDCSKRSGDAAIFNLFGREQKVFFRKGDLIAA